ncbi:hypothetical protein MNB_SM-5-166 [hydrothermal vent metagenome]|uniref:Uncharacterized protein n=1 Tax=hydrothermal vent metagenome TaxID=652676 RepID=A0A1W1BXY8_9ZZZZ
MIQFIPLLLFALFATGCVNKHGVSLKYYSECKEYYDMQGYYHKRCGDDDIITYKGIKKGYNNLTKKRTKPKGNVW